MMICNPLPAQIPRLQKLWKLAFGDDDWFIRCFFENGFSLERCRCIQKGEEILAALYWFDGTCEGQHIAYLYGVATHPDYRGQGLCRTLMEDTHRHLAAMGCSSVLLVPQKPPLREMYRKLGYRDCTRVHEFFCAEGPYPTPIHAIDCSEYAQLRRELLPPGSVIQEGSNLLFLSSYAKCYQGVDFLMAAAPDGESLFAMEYLGNPESAPGILCALGYAQGTFRAPGDKIPFAMFYPLAEHAIPPSYLGFAFD